jgi:hypothetical protein
VTDLWRRYRWADRPRDRRARHHRGPTGKA